MGVGVGVAVGVGVGVGVAFFVKAAISVIEPLIVIETGVFVPEYEPVPLPVQPPNVYPLVGVALIEIGVPLFFHPLAGLTVPPVPVIIVR